MSRSGLRLRAITRIYTAISMAALSAALCWPVTSFGSADYTDRALRKASIVRAQPIPRLSVVHAPIFNGYYGPVIRPPSFFGGKW